MEDTEDTTTINTRNRSEKDRLEQERQAKLEAMKAEERTGIAGAEEFEPWAPPQDAPKVVGTPEAQDIGQPLTYIPSAGVRRLTDELPGPPRRPSSPPSGIPGEWHDSMLIAGWEYHETADSQLYRKPKQRPRYGGMR